MVNEDYEPTENDDAILSVIADYEMANPYLLREETGLSKGDVNNSLSRLTAAGWVEKVTRGLYEFVEDPRSSSADLIADALEGWSPGQGGDDTRQRREIGVAVLRWLRDNGGRAAKSDFIDALYDETHLDGQQPGTWWETTARKALQHARDRGFVGYESRKYWWVD